MSETVVTLKHPVDANGEEHTQITLRRPTVKDLMVFDREKGEVAKMAALIGVLAGWPPTSVQALDAEDFVAVSEVVGGFLGSFLPTGGR